MQGPIIQITGKAEFKGGLRIEKQFEAINNLQRVCTISEINPIINASDGVVQVPLGAEKNLIWEVPRNQWY